MSYRLHLLGSLSKMICYNSIKGALLFLTRIRINSLS